MAREMTVEEIRRKIEALKMKTIANGCTAGEVAAAKEALERLQARLPTAKSGGPSDKAKEHIGAEGGFWGVDEGFSFTEDFWKDLMDSWRKASQRTAEHDARVKADAEARRRREADHKTKVDQARQNQANQAREYQKAAQSVVVNFHKYTERVQRIRKEKNISEGRTDIQFLPIYAPSATAVGVENRTMIIGLMILCRSMMSANSWFWEALAIGDWCWEEMGPNGKPRPIRWCGGTNASLMAAQNAAKTRMVEHYANKVYYME